MYTIYIHINKINQKKYIGQTKQEPEKRWGKHGEKYANCTYFYNAIQKYGWNNFEHIIVATDLTQEEANQMEIELIKLFKTQDAQYGYNILPGGQGNVNYENLSAGLVKRWEVPGRKEAYSQKMKEYYKNLSPQEFENIQSKKRGDNHPKSKAVICKENNMRFGSIREAAKWCGLVNSPSNISAQIYGKRKSAGTHPITGEKLHWYFEQDGIENSSEIQPRKTRARKVKNIETNLIFNSLTEAAKWAGVKNNRICESCKSNGKNAAGKHPETGVKLHWVYFNS